MDLDFARTVEAPWKKGRGFVPSVARQLTMAATSGRQHLPHPFRLPFLPHHEYLHHPRNPLQLRVSGPGPLRQPPPLRPRL
jgi:hypothetical protein